MDQDEYLDLVTHVVKARRDEIEQDLASARRVRDEAAMNLAEAERRVMSYEFLLSLAAEGVQEPPERMRLHDAMAHVLASVPAKRLPAGDLAREINRRGLYKMRDGRPVEPQQIHARVGNYRDRFDRNDRGIGLI
ncbi:hypothetical protein ACFQU3_19790 [Terrabacter sp. GCM10028922]|uniref:hypothetical protein n=1 Tax=Terrabacter sp. GCM10028922 TaxID=3273428 RepID=UPI003619B7D8